MLGGKAEKLQGSGLGKHRQFGSLPRRSLFTLFKLWTNQHFTWQILEHVSLRQLPARFGWVSSEEESRDEKNSSNFL